MFLSLKVTKMSLMFFIVSLIQLGDISKATLSLFFIRKSGGLFGSQCTCSTAFHSSSILQFKELLQCEKFCYGILTNTQSFRFVNKKILDDLLFFIIEHFGYNILHEICKLSTKKVPWFIKTLISEFNDVIKIFVA